MAVEYLEAHWRDSALPPRFWLVDARAVYPLFLWLMHMRIWTFVVAIICMAFFVALERFGFTVPVFLRLLRNFLSGSRKLAKPWWHLKQR